ncbi:MAG: hypothetical protein JSS78_08970 [Bacteroidetes bacterium]|nr:hypothetical protein [Bacteroidota bacterium]
MYRTFLKTLTIGILSIGWWSCSKTQDSSPTNISNLDSQKIFCVCEGSYGNGNASLGLYLPKQDTVYFDIFKDNNAGKQLGDVFQSMIRMGDQYVLCINNSDRVLVLNSDLKWLKTIAVSKPRYVVSLNNQQLLISSLFNNKIYVANIESGSIDATLPIPARNAEGLLRLNNNVYIAPWDTANNKVYVLDAAKQIFVDSLTGLGFAPSELLLDRDSMIWVLSGNVAMGKPAMFTRINPKTKQILTSLAFNSGFDVVRPCLNSTGDSLYFIEVNYSGSSSNNGIYRMSIHAQNLPINPFVAASAGQYFWALGISPFTGDIYIGDPRGFTQKSLVSIYKSDGTLKHQFNVGVGIGHFYFSK